MNGNSKYLIRLLVIDDDESNLELIVSALAQDGLEIIGCADSKEGLTYFRQFRPHIALIDMVLPGNEGLQIMREMVSNDPAVEVILMAANSSTEGAVDAIHRGARDFLNKPLKLPLLRARIGKLIDDARERQKALSLEDELVNTYQFEGMVGRSPLMLDVFTRIRRIAPHYRMVLIEGATGTGKELVARALYLRSPAADKTFAVCNCSAIVETLVESELFGYVRGAFTGAQQDKIGLFEYANGGTVFLDEIGELSLAAQAKLLRVLQDQEIQRVGSPVIRKVNVRIIAATNRDLRALVAENKFRGDLYYRLSTIEIRLPTLTERGEDLRLLQNHFLKQFSAQYNRHFSGITRRAQVALGRYAWPGNVRELGNVLGNACMLAENDVIDVCDLPSRILKNEATLSPVDVHLSLEEIQRRHILRVLDAVGDDKRNAAEVLGIGISTLYAFLAKNKRGENGSGRKRIVALTSEPYLVEAPPARNELRLRARKG